MCRTVSYTEIVKNEETLTKRKLADKIVGEKNTTNLKWSQWHLKRKLRIYSAWLCSPAAWKWWLVRCSVTNKCTPWAQYILSILRQKERRLKNTGWFFLEKNCKKTSISTSLSSFKINAIADVYLGKVLHIFWHSTFISAAVPHTIVIHREFSQASDVVDTNWKIQWTMRTIKKLHFNTELCPQKKIKSTPTVWCKLLKKELLTILQGNSEEFWYRGKQTWMAWVLKQNYLNNRVIDHPGGFSVKSLWKQILKLLALDLAQIP